MEHEYPEMLSEIQAKLDSKTEQLRCGYPGDCERGWRLAVAGTYAAQILASQNRYPGT